MTEETTKNSKKETLEERTSKTSDLLGFAAKFLVPAYIGAFAGMYIEGSWKGALAGAIALTAFLGIPLASKDSESGRYSERHK